MIGGRRQGSGRKPFKPTPEERKIVSALAGYGVPIAQIATFIERNGKPVNFETIGRHMQEDIQIGKAKANSQIGKRLFQKAMDGDTTALIFWAKTQMRWSENQPQEDNKAQILSALDEMTNDTKQ